MSEPEGKSKRGEADAAGELRAALLPVEPARNHEVQGEEEVVLEHEDDPLAEPPHCGDPPPLCGADGRLGGPEQERAPEPDRLERRAAHPRLDRLDVDRDVRQLGHGVILSRESPPRQPERRRPAGRAPC